MLRHHIPPLTLIFRHASPLARPWRQGTPQATARKRGLVFGRSAKHLLLAHIPTRRPALHGLANGLPRPSLLEPDSVADWTHAGVKLTSGSSGSPRDFGVPGSLPCRTWSRGPQFKLHSAVPQACLWDRCRSLIFCTVKAGLRQRNDSLWMTWPVEPRSARSVADEQFPCPSVARARPRGGPRKHCGRPPAPFLQYGDRHRPLCPSMAGQG
jgi:hypothetical protein